MSAAYSPGLRVTANARIEKTRRLPLRGDVLVRAGEHVTSGTIVARTELPGKVFSMNAAGLLNVLEADVASCMKKAVGEAFSRGEILAESPGIWGFFRSRVEAPIDGVIDSVSAATGRILLREAPIPVEVRAYIDGVVTSVLEGEGCVVETTGALCQGIFGLGGETEGTVRVVAAADEPLLPSHFAACAPGDVAVGGSIVSLDAFEAARAAKVSALVCGGIEYDDVRRLLGKELGVAITGTETLGLTLVVTEGFGAIPMSKTAHSLLSGLAGRRASVSGATQIRAGVIRPEVIASSPEELEDSRADAPSVLGVGARIRITRTPHFGALGEVVALPIELAQMPCETSVRVLVAKLTNGEEVVVPRANVEVVES